MTDKKQLKKDELEKVSGGLSAVLDNPYKQEYTIEINKYETENHIGETLYFDCDKADGRYKKEYTWVLGTLLRSFEQSNGCGTIRMATITIIESGGNIERSGTIDICLDGWQAHIK